MASEIRFSSSNLMFEEFPALAASMSARGGEESPQAFARSLLKSNDHFGAITVVAFVLPRREAVWWGAQGLRALSAGVSTDPAFIAAEAWVRKPEEARRVAAFDLGVEADSQRPSAFLALAAGSAGGNLAPPGVQPISPSRDITPIAVKAAVILALAARPAAEQGPWAEALVEAGLRFAEGEDLVFAVPTVLKLAPGRVIGPQ